MTVSRISRLFLLSIVITASGSSAVVAQGRKFGPPDRGRSPRSSLHHLVQSLPFEEEGLHYQVRSDISQQVARQSLRVLEAAWPIFIRRFGVEAKVSAGQDRHQVFVYSSRELYRSQKRPSMEPWTENIFGFFDRIHGVAHVEYSPQDYSHRSVLIHEAAHQFHYLSLAHGKFDIRPRWYVEGVAIDLARHQYQSGRLDLMVGEAPFTRGYEDLAVEYFSGPGFWMNALLEGHSLDAHRTSWQRQAVGAMFVSFFREHEDRGYRQWFHEFERAVSKGRKAPAWPDGFTGSSEIGSELLEFTRARLPARTTPRFAWWNEWGRIRACVRPGARSTWPLFEMPVDGRDATVSYRLDDLLLDNELVGFTLGFLNESNFSTATFSSGYRTLVFSTREAGRWNHVREIQVEREEIPEKPLLEACCGSDGSVEIRLDGEPVLFDSLPDGAARGALGLHATAIDRVGEAVRSRVIRFGPVTLTTGEH